MVIKTHQLQLRLKEIYYTFYENYTGTVYYGFALSEIDNTKIIIDALIVTKEKGILAINFSSFNKDQDIEKWIEFTFY